MPNGKMRRSDLPSARRSLPFSALSWALSLSEKTGLMHQPLDTEALVAAARRRTRLDDFGNETFREPLSRLLASCATEARLNIFGKCALAQDILQLLTNRLQMQRDHEKWPRIGDESIIAPIFIVGLPRTGTTLLHGLLAQDLDACHAPATWEVMFPSPPPSFGENKRIRQAQRRLACFNLLAPEFRKIHPISACFPQECIAIMSHSFMSDQFCAMYDVPAYESWLLKQDMEPAYKFHRQFLQHLQYGRAARRFVLKAPAHLLFMDVLFEMYPDALVVQTHREPLEVLPSLASLTTVLRSIFSDSVDPAAIGRDMTKYWLDALAKILDARTGFRSHAFFDVDYSDLVRDPIAVVRRIYNELGSEISSVAELRMRTFLKSHSPGKHGRHSYSLAEFGMNPLNISECFRAYRARFNLPDVNCEHVSLSE
jgi:Sulfotransferase family